MFVHVFKVLLRNVFLLDVSAVRLVKPVHIHSFFKDGHSSFGVPGTVVIQLFIAELYVGMGIV